eukprot:PhF_6_TR21724/c0_g1_i2/m.31044/K06173/truA, PUS1; tRNA pseudouridine38-40 synthase
MFRRVVLPLVRSPLSRGGVSNVVVTLNDISPHGRRLYSTGGGADDDKGLKLQPTPAGGERSHTTQTRVVDSSEEDVSDGVMIPSFDSSTQPLLAMDDAFQFFPLNDGTVEKLQTLRVPGTPTPAPGHTRYRVDVQYSGTKYYGWLRRKLKGTLPTVQDAVEDALAVALNLDRVEVVSSTLTETGVHCRRLTCHVDIPSNHTVPSHRVILQRCHAWLHQRQDEVAILCCIPAVEGFHAHHAATSRTYVYRILNRIPPPIFEPKQVWHFDRNLNVIKMQEAALRFEGQHDFGGLTDHRVSRAVKQHGASYTIRTLHSVKVVRQADEVLVWFNAKSFLR